MKIKIKKIHYYKDKPKKHTKIMFFFLQGVLELTPAKCTG